jgi:OPA family sugar phosphate sensor protein UhpC-like MFS transporter
MGLLNFIKPAPPIPVMQDKAAAERLYKRYRLAIMLAITIGYGFYYTCRVGLSVVRKPLIDSGILSIEQIGWIAAVGFYGYAFGKLINGFLADYSNVRKLFSLGLLLSAICNAVFGFSKLYWVFLAAWALNGWVQGFGAACCGVSLANWFTYRHRGKYYGIWSSAHSIGEGLTFVGTSALVLHFGWRGGFVGPAIACTIMAALAYLAMKDRPASCGLPPAAELENEPVQFVQQPAEQKSTLSSQLEMFKMPALWLLCFSSAAMYITRYAVTSWGMLYLQEIRGFETMQAGYLLAINTILGISGGICYGFISDLIFKGRRPPASLLYGLFNLFAMFMIFVFPVKSFWMLAFLMGIFGFTIGGLLVGLGGLFAVDIASNKASGAALGFVGVFSYIATALQENISAWLIKSGSTVVDGVITHYNFDKAIVFWIGASAVSVLLSLMTWKAKVSG